MNIRVKFSLVLILGVPFQVSANNTLYEKWKTAVSDSSSKSAEKTNEALTLILKTNNFEIVDSIFDDPTSPYLKAMGTAASEYNGPNVAELYDHLLGSKNKGARAAATVGVHSVDHGHQQEELMNRLLKTDNVEIRMLAVDGLRPIRGPKLAEYFEKFLNDPSPEVKKRAADLLKKIKLSHEEAVPLFESLISSTNKQVSNATVNALRFYIGPVDRAALLTSLLKSTELKSSLRSVPLNPDKKDERGNIAKTIRNTDGKIVPNMKVITIDEAMTRNAVVRPILEKVLPYFEGPDGDKVFGEIFHIKDPMIRILGVDTLNRYDSLNRPEIIKGLLSSHDPIVSHSMKAYLSHASGENVDKLFETLLKDPKFRDSALESLQSFTGIPLDQTKYDLNEFPEHKLSTANKDLVTEKWIPTGEERYKYKIYNHLLSVDDQQVRIDAANSLLSAPKSVQGKLFQTALEDPSKIVRKAAGHSLMEVTGDSKFLARILEPLLMEKISAKYAVHFLIDKADDNVFQLLLKSGEGSVRLDVRDALLKCTRPEIRNSKLLQDLFPKKVNTQVDANSIRLQEAAKKVGHLNQINQLNMSEFLAMAGPASPDDPEADRETLTSYHRASCIDTSIRRHKKSPILDFSAPNQDGKIVKLSQFKGSPVLIFFYPKDHTPGCTAEACNFRDQYEEFEKRGAVIVGMSRQDSEEHQSFIKKHGLPFDLLVDKDGSIAKSYGIGNIPLFGFLKRKSLLIGPDGRLIKFYDDVDPKKHTAEVLRDLEVLQRP